jgi:hypothetical protein
VLVFAAFMIAIGYGVVAPALPAFARSFDLSVAARVGRGHRVRGGASSSPRSASGWSGERGELLHAP